VAYAENTAVPVERSRAEIEKLLKKHKCTQFMVGVDHETHSAMVQFRANNRIVRFVVKMPDPKDKAYSRDRNGWQLSPSGIEKKVEQGERQRWRALLLVIKAKLESVENQIATFEEEFLAHIVMPNDRTVADLVMPLIERAYESGSMPRAMLPEGVTTESPVIDVKRVN
jgi:hypothetical protein